VPLIGPTCVVGRRSPGFNPLRVYRCADFDPRSRQQILAIVSNIAARRRARGLRVRRAKMLFGRFTVDLALVLLFVLLMRNQVPNDTDQPALQRDPDEWKTGDEPMTDAQRSYLETLCRETGEEFDETLSKAEASKRIDQLRERSPRLSATS
jgi:hypothetical protein